MKFYLAIAAPLLSLNIYAAEEYAQIDVNWNSRYMEETVTLMCDDSYYAGVEITVPGTYRNIESSIRYVNCGADVKITKKQIFIENGVEKTKIRVKTSESCDLEIRNDKDRKKVFTVSIADAC